MALGSPATDVIMTAVELVMAAVDVGHVHLVAVGVCLLDAEQLHEAPRVPEPSSREYTEMGPLADAPLSPASVPPSPAAAPVAPPAEPPAQPAPARQRPAQGRRSNKRRHPPQPPRQTRRYRRCFMTSFLHARAGAEPSRIRSP